MINENDTVATAEIRFGDNDRLAARVAAGAQADALVLLSDIDGLYTADPRRNPAAHHLPVVERVSDEIMAMGGDPPPGYSSGGMRTKLLAARIATSAGCAMAIALGTRNHPLRAIEDGARCTWFLPQPEGRSSRKRWIAGSLAPLGTLTVDEGAARALARGSSLLPAGVRAVTGEFGRGDPVSLVDMRGREVARGLSAYDADSARRIAGRRSDEIEAILGWRGRTRWSTATTSSCSDSESVAPERPGHSGRPPGGRVGHPKGATCSPCDRVSTRPQASHEERGVARPVQRYRRVVSRSAAVCSSTSWRTVRRSLRSGRHGRSTAERFMSARRK